MQRTVGSWVAAGIMLTATFGATMPACRIELCKGSGCGGDPDVGGWSAEGSSGSVSSSAGGGGGGAPSVDDAADAAVIAGSDPVELSRAQLRSNVAAYMLWGYVQQDVDPAILNGGDAIAINAAAQDVATAYGEQIWEQAGQYVDSLDPSVLPAAVTVVPDHNCMTTFGCAATMFCGFDFGQGESLVPCHITGCGAGACPACPDLFNLDSLIVKHWCSFTCVKDQKSVVGIGIQVHLQISGILEGCWLLSTPVPCTGIGCPG